MARFTATVSARYPLGMPVETGLTSVAGNASSQAEASGMVRDFLNVLSADDGMVRDFSIEWGACEQDTPVAKKG